MSQLTNNSQDGVMMKLRFIVPFNTDQEMKGVQELVEVLTYPLNLKLLQTLPMLV